MDPRQKRIAIDGPQHVDGITDVGVARTAPKYLGCGIGPRPRCGCRSRTVVMGPFAPRQCGADRDADDEDPRKDSREAASAGSCDSGIQKHRRTITVQRTVVDETLSPDDARYGKYFFSVAKTRAPRERFFASIRAKKIRCNINHTMTAFHHSRALARARRILANPREASRLTWNGNGPWITHSIDCVLGLNRLP